MKDPSPSPCPAITGPKKAVLSFFYNWSATQLFLFHFRFIHTTYTHLSPDSFQQMYRKYCAPVKRSVRPYNANMDEGDFCWFVHNNAWEIRAGFMPFIFVAFKAIVDRI